jgi:cytochrome c551/c552
LVAITKIKVVGPSHGDIANKYAATDKNINYLSGQIIKGGSGVWGNLPMGAHSSLLTKMKLNQWLNTYH